MKRWVSPMMNNIQPIRKFASSGFYSQHFSLTSFLFFLPLDSMSIRIDEVLLKASSLPVTSTSSPQSCIFTIEVSLRRGLSFATTMSSTTLKRTSNFKISSDPSSSTLLKFLPSQSSSIQLSLPPTTRISCDSVFSLTLKIKVSNEVSITRKYRMNYEDGLEKYRRISGIDTKGEDGQGINMAWKLIGDKNDLGGLEENLEDYLRVADREEKDEITRRFQVS